YPAETVRALWNLVWKGLATNDTFHALRAYTQVAARRRDHRRRLAGKGGRAGWPSGGAHAITPARSRRLAPPSAEGRWSLLERRADGRTTAWATDLTAELLTRHGVLTREAVVAESIPGGFGLVYPVLKAMEEHGRIRRGYFVAGLGATQFALPGALDLLRSMRDAPDEIEVAVLAATDPANPYCATLRFPASPAETHIAAAPAEQALRHL